MKNLFDLIIPESAQVKESQPIVKLRRPRHRRWLQGRTQYAWTYFISEIRTGNIKIGVSCSPEGRLANMQSCNSSPLVLLCKTLGDREAEFHLRFTNYRLQGEWFSPDTELLEFIQSLRLAEDHEHRLITPETDLPN